MILTKHDLELLSNVIDFFLNATSADVHSSNLRHEYVVLEVKIAIEILKYREIEDAV